MSQPTILFLILSLTVSLPAKAQKKFLMGVKSGINIATQEVKGPYPFSIQPIVRTHIGVITELKLNKIGFQGEFMYSGHGCQYSGILNQQLKSTFDYINVPLMFKWYITDNLSLVVGPQFGMIFDQEFQDDRTGVVTSEDFSTLYSRFETSVGGGIEWEFYNRIGIYGRYIYGITEIDEGISYLPFTKNKTLQFGLSYRF